MGADGHDITRSAHGMGADGHDTVGTAHGTGADAPIPYSSKPSGSSTTRLNARSHCAPRAPSTTR
jgi:hypothetical protein